MPSNAKDTDTQLVRAFLQFNRLYRFSSHDIDGAGSLEADDRFKKLKYSECLLLFYIRSAVKSKSDGVSATELSGMMNVKPPTINPLLTNLEKVGLIERKTDPNDRRFLRIKLSEDGMNLTTKYEQALFHKVHGLANFLGEEKSRNLIALMNDVYTYFSKQEHCEEKKPQ